MSFCTNYTPLSLITGITPVFKLLGYDFDVFFRPVRATRCTREGEIRHGGIYLRIPRLSVQGWDVSPKTEKFFLHIFGM